MNQKKQSKMMAILALCISVLGLTLGFAAFSNTLTISSSATVTPDASDFKLKLYGMDKSIENDDINMEDSELISLLTSSTNLAPIIEVENMMYPSTGPIAVIDNDTLTLKGLNAEFTGPDHNVIYPFLIKNEGQYDAYTNIATYQNPTHTCEAGEGTTESLAAKACENMKFRLSVGYLDETSQKIKWDINDYVDATGNLKLEKGKFFVAYIQLEYDYSEDRVDGPMTVKWSDLKLTFTTSAQ